MPADGMKIPTAANCLESADTIPEKYREPTDEYEALYDERYQHAWPAVQVGRLRNETKE